MAIHRCGFCGSMHDEEKEGVPVRESKACPVCRIVSDKLVPAGGAPNVSGNESRLFGSVPTSAAPVSVAPASAVFAPVSPEKREAFPYDPEYARLGTDSRYMDETHEMATKGKSAIAAMGTQMSIPGWDDILFLGAQPNPMSLNEHTPVRTETTIGKKVRKPMVSEHSVYVSYMSFGALPKETKIVLTMDSAMARTAVRSGKGGILPRERGATYKYILEHVPNLYSMSGENLRCADAIEIKIGQGTRPGMDGHLSSSKMTLEIMAVCDKPLDRDVVSPSRFPGIDSKEDLRAPVDRLREESEGRSIGIEIAVDRIKKGLEFCVYVGPDFITIDDRGGAAGASSKLIRDSASVPTIYALYRTRKYLDGVGANMELVVTGGPRVSSDLTKALAMGAGAVAIASTALIVAAYQQHRICGISMCPVGVAVQNEALHRRLSTGAAAQRMADFLNVSLEEIKTFARTTGYHNIHDTDVDDLCTISKEVSELINIRHIQSSWKHRPVPGFPYEVIHP